MSAPAGGAVVIGDRELARIQRFIRDAAGITLASTKKALVMGRLHKRLARHGLRSYHDYLDLLESGADPGERQVAVDLLTTNETYFFREPRQLEVLREAAVAHGASARVFRAWSAACSSGEEPYSIAMVLADVLGSRSWSVLGSDISRRVLERAATAHYPLTRAEQLPRDYRARFCLRGTGAHEGTLLVERALRERVELCQINLDRELPQLPEMDVIFLRNVLIYFDAETKRRVVERVLGRLRRGGWLLLGHTEGLGTLPPGLRMIAPSTYRKR